MAKQPFYAYAVMGRGPFPVDMLRYDRSTPLTEQDAAEIASALTEFYITGEKVTHRINLMSTAKPAVQRWNSFGWTVCGAEYL